MKILPYAFITIGLFFNTFSSFSQQKKKSGNPIFPGWYADPEARIFDNTYWVYPTYSDDYGVPDRSASISDAQLITQKNTINPQYLKQTFLNAFFAMRWFIDGIAKETSGLKITGSFQFSKLYKSNCLREKTSF